VVIGIEEEKGRNLKSTDFHPPRPDCPSRPIATRIGMVSDMEDMKKLAKFGFDRLIGACSVG
jgi:hypothetical protein